jgi:ribosomal protein S27E
MKRIHKVACNICGNLERNKITGEAVSHPQNIATVICGDCIMKALTGGKKVKSRPILRRTKDKPVFKRRK